MPNIIIWAIICVACLIFEFITIGDFITIWFSLGAFVACILCNFYQNVTVQIIVFVVISCLALILLRPICLKSIKNSEGNTNLDLIKKSKVKIINPISSDKMGTAKLEGVLWNCVAESDTTIESGTLCDVVRIDGNKLVVKPCEPSQN